MRRLNLTGIGHFDVTDETRLVSEFTYSKRWSTQQMAPQPVWFDFTYDGDAMGDHFSHGVADGKDISYGRRMTDVGPRGYEQAVDTVRAVIGLDGALTTLGLILQ